MINNSFHLTQIIASVWGDPSDITDVVWHSGYRKPEREATEIAQLTIDIMEGVPDEAPYNSRPKNLDDILFGELNDIVFSATWSDKATPASVARVILESGYIKEEK
ncbi:hypothetical protein ACP179_20680 [Xenorhabdus stockiae]|uniref:hypothetical protein n=1 Tax=Xenorhabdus stockiae TaxID=351614 RepID=UPI003CEDE6C2